MKAIENPSRSLVEQAIRAFGRVRFRVLGSSMAPSVLPGDFVSVQRAELSEISLGEIVLFSRDERLFVHRVVSRAVECEDPTLTTRGDRLGYDDPPVNASSLLGRVTSIERNRRVFGPGREVVGWNRLVLPALRASDLATRAYLHFLRRIRKQRGLLSPSVAEDLWVR